MRWETMRTLPKLVSAPGRSAADGPFSIVWLIVALIVFSTAHIVNAAACAPYGSDQGTVAAARGAVAAACDCSSAASRTEWRACVTTALDRLRDAAKPSRSCIAQVLDVETKSDCGRAGIVGRCRD